MISSSFPIQLGCLADEDAHRQIRINGRIMGGNSRAKHGGVHGAGVFCGHRRMCACESDPRWRVPVERWRSAFVIYDCLIKLWSLVIFHIFMFVLGRFLLPCRFSIVVVSLSPFRLCFSTFFFNQSFNVCFVLSYIFHSIGT